MKNTLISLALASTLVLGNGCGERKPREIYTLNEENTEVILKDYWHEFCMEIKTPESKKTIYAEKYKLDDTETHLTRIIIYTPNSTSDYSRVTEKGRAVLRTTKPEFDKYFKAMQQEKTTNTPTIVRDTIESSNLFKQFE